MVAVTPSSAASCRCDNPSPSRYPAVDNWGWIYFFHNEDPSQELQVYAECKAGEVYGMIGPQADGSSEGNPMPDGFAPAVPAGFYSMSSFVTLNYVYHGAETGLAGVGQPMDQVAMATFDDPAAGTTTLFLVGASPRGNDAPYLYAMSAVLPQSGSPQAALAESSAWTRSQLALPKWQQVGDRSTPSALSAGSLAVQDVGLVYFWNEADYSDGKIGWRFLSTAYSLDPPADPYWGSAIEMRDETGAPIGSGGFNCGQYAATDQRFTPRRWRHCPGFQPCARRPAAARRAGRQRQHAAAAAVRHRTNFP